MIDFFTNPEYPHYIILGLEFESQFWKNFIMRKKSSVTCLAHRNPSFKHQPYSKFNVGFLEGFPGLGDTVLRLLNNFVV